MKKLFLSLTVVGSFFLYSLYVRKDNIAVIPAIPPKSQIVSPEPISNPEEGFGTIREPAGLATNRPTPKITVNPIPTQAIINAPQPTSKPAGQFKDGTYTGSVADAYYGNIQVSGIFTNGTLTDVTFLQYPNDRDRSIRINQYAMPILRQEAISAQSANVDIVSGATDSSQAFIQSMASVLSQAKNI